jgi:hypothetical protein
MLPRLLNNGGQLPATFFEDGALIETGHIYVAPFAGSSAKGVNACCG